MKPLVSILIPAYNTEKWIGATINSVIAQTWPHKEIIIVDDGSTDSSFHIAKKFESKSVKVVTQENSGACVARNKALSFAQGDYIQWIDADDLLAPDKISQQLKKGNDGQNSRILLTSAFGTFFSHYQKAKFKPNSLWRDLSPVDWMSIKFSEIVWMNPATWLVSRKLADMAGQWDERLLMDQDGEYICRVVANSETVKFVKSSKCYYRIGNIGSVSMNKSYKAAESYLLAARLCINYLRSLEDSERVRAACLKFLENRLVVFYPDKHELIQKANELALELGGELSLPTERLVYYLIRKTFGLNMARNAKKMVLKTKTSVHKIWERLY